MRYFNIVPNSTLITDTKYALNDGKVNGLHTVHSYLKNKPSTCRRVACVYTNRTGIKLWSSLLWHYNTIWLNGSRGPTRFVACCRSIGHIT